MGFPFRQLFAWPYKASSLGLVAALFLSTPTPGFAQPYQTLLENCGLKQEAAGKIASVNPLGRLQLEDGRKYRLSGIWLLVAGDEPAVSQLVGRSILPFRASKGPDRLGFIAAHILLDPLSVTSKGPRPSVQNWLQAELLSAGKGFIYLYPGHESCADNLRSYEAKAREERTGLWSKVLRDDIANTAQVQSGALIVGDANDLEIESASGRYGIISGIVISTGESGRWRYLNFGDNYASDFTVRMTARVEKRLIEQGLTIKGLKDMHVRVRGVIQSKGGPLIDVFDAAQIEMME